MIWDALYLSIYLIGKYNSVQIQYSVPNTIDLIKGFIERHLHIHHTNIIRGPNTPPPSSNQQISTPSHKQTPPPFIHVILTQNLEYQTKGYPHSKLNQGKMRSVSSI